MVFYREALIILQEAIQAVSTKITFILFLVHLIFETILKFVNSDKKGKKQTAKARETEKRRKNEIKKGRNKERKK